MPRERAELVVHPTTPDLEPLTEYIADMPGGNYIGRKWLEEPLVLCAVSADEYRWALQVTAAAYPPHRSSLDNDIYMFAIPATVARVLVWQAEENVHSALTQPLPWCDDVAHVAAGLAGCIEDIYALDEWATGLTQLATMSAGAGLPWKDVFNVVARIYADDTQAHPLDDLIEPAIAALRTP